MLVNLIQTGAVAIVLSWLVILAYGRSDPSYWVMALIVYVMSGATFLVVGSTLALIWAD